MAEFPVTGDSPYGPKLKAYVDEQDDMHLSAAKDYTDNEVADAKTYTDNEVSAGVSAAVAQTKSELTADVDDGGSAFGAALNGKIAEENDTQVPPLVEALVPGEVADAVDGHVPGSSLAYAVRNSSLTTTEVFPAVAAIASLALTVTGAGRPVEVEFYVPEIYHSVVNARPGIGIAYQRDSIYVGTLRSVSKRSYSTTEGDQLFVKSQIVLDDGIDYFFYPVFGAFSAGTTSLKVSGATGGPVMTMSVVSR